MQIPLALADPVLVEEVSIPLWRATFEELGWPASLAGKRDGLTLGRHPKPAIDRHLKTGHHA